MRCSNPVSVRCRRSLRGPGHERGPSRCEVRPALARRGLRSTADRGSGAPRADILPATTGMPIASPISPAATRRVAGRGVQAHRPPGASGRRRRGRRRTERCGVRHLFEQTDGDGRRPAHRQNGSRITATAKARGRRRAGGAGTGAAWRRHFACALCPVRAGSDGCRPGNSGRPGITTFRQRPLSSGQRANWGPGCWDDDRSSSWTTTPIAETLADQFEAEPRLALSTAATLAEAGTILNATDAHIDAVILDIGMPDGDGCDFCLQLRRQGHKMPVIMLSDRLERRGGRSARPGRRRQRLHRQAVPGERAAGPPAGAAADLRRHARRLAGDRPVHLSGPPRDSARQARGPSLQADRQGGGDPEAPLPRGSQGGGPRRAAAGGLGLRHRHHHPHAGDPTYTACARRWSSTRRSRRCC